MYQVNGKKFENYTEAADYARQELTGMHYEDYLLIEEWQEEGFWEPRYRVERDRGGKPVVRLEWVIRDNQP